MIEDLYAEMDDINNRISLLVAAVKVVGVYDRPSATEKWYRSAIPSSLS
jgi:hypothetical protein